MASLTEGCTGSDLAVLCRGGDAAELVWLLPWAADRFHALACRPHHVLLCSKCDVMPSMNVS